jgi:folate-binding protein YgfZ
MSDLQRTVRRDGLSVEGPDALDWLQGQLSQDLAGLSPGAPGRYTLVLSPQGKIDSFCRITSTGPDAFLIDVEAGHGDALHDRLKRFKLRVKATLERVEVVCEEAPERGWDALSEPVVVDPAMGSVDAAGASTSAVGGSGSGDAAGVGDEATEAFAAARIEAGVPRLGRELTERTIPQEAGPELIARTVSFSKGCYTGQELVARLDSRGSNVPRRLRALVIEGHDGAPRPAPGDEVVVNGAAAGTLTSTAWSAAASAHVALGYVKRSALAASGDASVVGAEGVPFRATIRPLPGESD